MLKQTVLCLFQKIAVLEKINLQVPKMHHCHLAELFGITKAATGYGHAEYHIMYGNKY